MHFLYAAGNAAPLNAAALRELNALKPFGWDKNIDKHQPNPEFFGGAEGPRRRQQQQQDVLDLLLEGRLPAEALAAQPLASSDGSDTSSSSTSSSDSDADGHSDSSAAGVGSGPAGTGGGAAAQHIGGRASDNPPSIVAARRAGLTPAGREASPTAASPAAGPVHGSFPGRNDAPERGGEPSAGDGGGAGISGGATPLDAADATGPARSAHGELPSSEEQRSPVFAVPRRALPAARRPWQLLESEDQGADASAADDALLAADAPRRPRPRQVLLSSSEDQGSETPAAEEEPLQAAATAVAAAAAQPSAAGGQGRRKRKGGGGEGGSPAARRKRSSGEQPAASADSGSASEREDTPQEDPNIARMHVSTSSVPLSFCFPDTAWFGLVHSSLHKPPNGIDHKRPWRTVSEILWSARDK